MGFEPTISAGKQPQTDALDRAATGIGTCSYIDIIKFLFCSTVICLFIVDSFVVLQ
jgi:hypothetical protein